MMNFSGKAVSSVEKKPVPLNPNAAEFVPLALRSSGTGIGNANASSRFAGTTTANGKKALSDRSQSSASSNSDDDIHQFWRHQLPDDITPDFKFMGVDDDDRGANVLPLSGSSLTGFGDNYPRGTNVMLKDRGSPPVPVNGNRYGEFRPSVGGKLWRNDRERGSQSYSETTSGRNLCLETSNERFFDNPLEFLASRFPGFAVESLAQVYFLNGGDVNLTVEMLNQFEGDESVSRNLESNALSNPTLGALDFPAPSGRDGSAAATGDYLLLNGGPFRSSGKENAAMFRSDSSGTATGWRMGNRDAGIWNYYLKGSSDATNIGSSRTSHILASSSYHDNNPPETRMIDLHGLHAIEALRALKREIAATRNAARAGGGGRSRGLVVDICIETRTTTTPAVRRYLMEEEGLDFSELQPGLLRVVVY